MTGTDIVAVTRLQAWSLFIRVDARRPASWLAVLAAAGGGWTDDPALAAAVAALATVAAVGDPPASAALRPDRAWLAARAVWPAAGTALAAITGGGWTVPAVGLATVAATAITLWLASSRNVRAADAASLTLAIAATAIACGLQAAAAGGPSLIVVATVWLVLAGAMRHVCQTPVTGASTSLPRGGFDALSRGGLPIHAPLRRLLGRLAMLTTLAAMVGWLLLDQERWPLAVTLALVWFVCLAVPAALLQQGAATNVWEPLMRSAAGQQSHRGFRRRRGAARTAADVAAAHAAVLGWPALVAAAVAAPAGSWRCLTVVLGLTVAAAVVAAIGFACARRRPEPETAQAAALAVAAVILLGLGTHGLRQPAGQFPILPGSPFSWPGKADVEQSAATCQTR